MNINKLMIIFVISLVLISFISAFLLNTFSDGTSTGNMTFTGAGSKYFNLSLPYWASISKAEVDLKGYAMYNITGINFSSNFSPSSPYNISKDITFNGSHIFSNYVFTGEYKLYVYNLSGYAIANYDLYSTLGQCSGLTFDGTYLWIGCDNDKIYKFYTNGTQTGFNFTNSDFVNIVGLTWDGEYLWGVDNGEVLRKINSITGVTIKSCQLSGTQAGGLVYDNLFDLIWYGDDGTDTWRIVYEDCTEIASFSSLTVSPTGLAKKIGDNRIYGMSGNNYDPINRYITHIGFNISSLYANLTIKTNNEITYQNLSTFNGTSAIDLNITLLQSCVDLCLYPSGNNCLCEINFTSATAGILEYSNINITWDDIKSPTFSNNQTNASSTTYNGTTVQINLTITDGTAVDFYRFTHNDTSDGAWLNDTLIDAGGISSITMVWNRTISNFSDSGGTFGWKVWANDTSDNIAYSDTYTFIIQNQDFTPLSACGNLNIANREYQLQNNINTTETCFNVTANNITLDCKGYEVNYSSDGSLGYGVYSNQNFTTIKNCVIKEGASAGSSKYTIYFVGAKNGTINNNTITTSGSSGSFSIKLDTSSSNSLTSNTITTSGSSGRGIDLDTSSNNNLTNNIITTFNKWGIGIYAYAYSNSNTISNNNITTYGNISYGIYTLSNSNSNTISNNNITTSGSYGYGSILSVNSNNNNVSNNIITTSGSYGYGIYLSSSSNSNTLSDNNITTLGNHSEGIDLSQSSNSNINLNIITTSGNHSNGIYLHSSSNSNSLSNNTITTSDTDSRGIDLSTNSNSNIISNNAITTSGHYGYGVILAVNSNSNTISNNAITTSEYNSHGIFLSSNSNSNTLSNNTITTSDTYSYGIWLSLSSNSNLSNNTITTYNTHSYGILLYDLSNSNTLSNNAITTSGTSGYGIHLRLSSNNNIFSQMNVKTNGTAGYAIYLYDTNHNFTIRDSILNSSYAGVQELYVTSEVTGGNWNFTNVTRSNGNRINITWGGSANGTLNMKWWLDINTTYGGGALQDANVNIFDKNNVLQFSELTDSNGKLKKALIEYTQYNNTNITYLSFYNVIINKSGYTSYSNSSVNMTTNLFINTALNFIPTTPILISPADTQALATNYAVLTYNSTDADNATDTLTFYVYNSTDNSYFSLLFSGSGWVNTTYNWSNLADDDYYWKVKAGDGKNNSSNSTSYKFTISSTTPAITLNYPTPNKYFNTRNISYFNFTAVDPDGLSMCILYHNLGDSWLINQTTTTASSNVMFSFNQTDLLTDEHNYIWNVWCNDTANNGGFASSNFTFHVDSAYPIMNITKITTTAGSQTISFDVDYTDYSISSCKYSIYDSDGDIDGLYNNISVTCESTGNPATVSGYATYTLRLYGKDTAGNENSTNLSFTTSQISITSPPSGGGGGTVITECAKDADCSKYGEKYKCIQGKCIYQEFEEVCNYNNVCEPERGENFRNCGDELVNNTEMVKGDCHPLNLADLGKLAKSSQLFVWIVLILIVLGSTYFYQTRPKSFYQRKLKPYFAKKRRKA